MSKAADLVFGPAGERTVLKDLQSLLGDDITKIEDKYSVMDYTNSNNTTYVELKSRNIPHHKFDTTIIGNNKIAFCTDPNRSYYFAFNFSDGLYYIKYDKDLFNTFKKDHNYFRYKRDDCVNVVQSVCHIPIKNLTKFNIVKD